MGNRGPACYINCGQGNNTQIQHINFVHKGNSSMSGPYDDRSDAQSGNSDTVKDKYGETLRGQDTVREDYNELEQEYKDIDAYTKYFRKTQFSRKFDSIMFVKSGGIILRNCQMSYGFVLKSSQAATRALN